MVFINKSFHFFWVGLTEIQTTKYVGELEWTKELCPPNI
jgi:hypothetical protein